MWMTLLVMTIAVGMLSILTAYYQMMDDAE
jgi:hypothetical protein